MISIRTPASRKRTLMSAPAEMPPWSAKRVMGKPNPKSRPLRRSPGLRSVRDGRGIGVAGSHGIGVAVCGLSVTVGAVFAGRTVVFILS